MRFLFILVLMLSQKFYSDDPVKQENDDAIKIEEVANHGLSGYYDFVQHTFLKPGDRTKRPAVNVNTLGEVPDSSWFQNRHGAVPMSIEELVRGANSGDGPSKQLPWQVVSLKTEGITPGLRIRDSTGATYLLKFDSPKNPELATAAEVISTKFFHAIGFNVPENYIVFFARDQLEPGHGVTAAQINAVLSRVAHSGDESYRAVASKLLAGTPVGPFQYFGTRPDDPNDIYSHENRRELRGLRVFAAWLNHNDTKASNSLDMLVTEDGRRYVRHYLIDFGSTLGSGGVGPQKPRYGFEYLFDANAAFKRFVTLGLWDRSWVRASYPHNPTIGRFESSLFEPEQWCPYYPNPAFLNLTPADAYWAAKIVMSFTDEEIRAVVNTAQLRDPQAAEYIAKTLIERRNKIGRAWLTTRNSADLFKLTADGDLKFDHLASAYGLTPKPELRVAWFRFDNISRELQPIEKLWPDPGYFMAEISGLEGTVRVYVRHTGHQPEIVGIER